MQLELAGKRVLVTGSSRGIGKVIAEILYDEGCIVTLNSRNVTDLSVAAKSLNQAFLALGDVTQPEEAQRVVNEAVTAMGGLDILVCNVGSGSSVQPGDETFDEWQRVFGLNLWSATNTIEAARKSLIDSKGTVVCISSICGIEVIPDAPVTYSAAKAALHAYVRGIARPFGKLGIRINAIAPGNILFDGSVWSRKLQEDANSVADMLRRDVSLGRLGTPKEVAELVAYLASPRSGFSSGSVWTLDGGQVHS